MTLTPAETCRKVADIIDHKNSRFGMGWWLRYTPCGTVACIAGHTALLHSDGIERNPHLASSPDGNRRSLSPDTAWEDRQAARLGLKPTASSLMFNPNSSIWRSSRKTGTDHYSLTLRLMAEKLEKHDRKSRTISARELTKIAQKALA